MEEEELEELVELVEELVEEVEEEEPELDTDNWKLCAKLGPAWHLEVMGTVLMCPVFLMSLSRSQWSFSYLSSQRGERE